MKSIGSTHEYLSEIDIYFPFRLSIPPEPGLENLCKWVNEIIENFGNPGTLEFSTTNAKWFMSYDVNHVSTIFSFRTEEDCLLAKMLK